MKLIVFLLAVGYCTAKFDYTGYKLIKVTPRSDADLSKLKAIQGYGEKKVEFWTEHLSINRHVMLLTSPEGFSDVQDTLRESKIEYDVTLPDVQRVISDQEEQRKAKPRNEDPFDIDFEEYHDFNTLMGWVDRVAALCGSRCTVYDIGASYEDRRIKMIKITGDGSARNSVLVDATIHAREWIAPATAVWFINEFVKNYDSNAEIRAAVNRFDWYFIPVLNPDGYEYTWTDDRLWRKTRSPSLFDPDCIGTDGNRNFDWWWDDPGSSPDPCSNNYAGDAPFSEPETARLRDVMASLASNLTGYLAYHSSGQWWLSPWGGEVVPPDDIDEMQRVGDAVVDAIFDVHGETYVAGPASTTLYLAAGIAIDWSYGQHNIVYSYTPELRDTGFWGHLLPPEFIRPTAEENLAGLLTMAREMRT